MMISALKANDLLMNELGDVIRIVNITFRVFPIKRDYCDLTIDCLTKPDKNILWSYASTDLLLKDEWVWHSRFGTLL